MNRRNFLRSLGLGVAALYLRFAPDKVAALPDWRDIPDCKIDFDSLFDKIYRIRSTRGPEIMIMTGNPGVEDWLFDAWMNRREFNR